MPLSQPFAAVKMVPSSFGCGSAVFAATTMLAPSWAARRAMARPMPRLAPVINLRQVGGREEVDLPIQAVDSGLVHAYQRAALEGALGKHVTLVDLLDGMRGPRRGGHAPQRRGSEMAGVLVGETW